MKNSVMHREFVTWYSHVALENDPSLFSARWESVSKLVNEGKYEYCTDLLDTFMCKPGATSGPAGDLMREAFTASDPTFPPSGNEAEMALLAEIILALILDQQEHSASVGYIACLVYSALHGGGVEVNSRTGLLARAQHTMRFQGNEARKRRPLPDAPKNFTPAIKIDDCFEEEVTDLANIETAKAILNKIVGKTARALGKFAQCAHEERRSLERELRIQGEELELLWWASNGQSGTTREQFSSMPGRGRPLIAAYEAANLTQFCPGPASIAGLLEKAGLKAHKKVALSEIVNQCDIDWLCEIQPKNVTATTPIHLAIDLRLPSPNSTAWSAHWSALTGIDPDKRCSEVRIAELFYQERLVLAR